MLPFCSAKKFYIQLVPLFLAKPPLLFISADFHLCASPWPPCSDILHPLSLPPLLDFFLTLTHSQIACFEPFPFSPSLPPSTMQRLELGRFSSPITFSCYRIPFPLFRLLSPLRVSPPESVLPPFLKFFLPLGFRSRFRFTVPSDSVPVPLRFLSPPILVRNSNLSTFYSSQNSGPPPHTFIRLKFRVRNLSF